MPPPVVKTLRDLIYWEYAKLIAGSAVGNRKNYGFIMHSFKKLRTGQLKPSPILTENKILVKAEKVCAYCGSAGHLHWEHVIPRSRGGPDTIDNIVLACEQCNLSKGDKDPFEWYGRDRRDEIPRLILGKYLKLVFDEHDSKGTLDATDLNGNSKIDIYDLGAIFK